jgi:hypothetical protein
MGPAAPASGIIQECSSVKACTRGKMQKHVHQHHKRCTNGALLHRAGDPGHARHVVEPLLLRCIAQPSLHTSLTPAALLDQCLCCCAGYVHTWLSPSTSRASCTGCASLALGTCENTH